MKAFSHYKRPFVDFQKMKLFTDEKVPGLSWFSSQFNATYCGVSETVASLQTRPYQHVFLAGCRQNGFGVP